MEDKTFTISAGVQIQMQQLAQWETVLKPVVHAELVKWATKYNNDPKLKSGYNVTRGSDLSNFVQNYMIGHNPEKITQTGDLL
jgi:hypothetical protein